MKKIVSIISLTLIFSLNVSASFKDVSKAAWYKSDIESLTNEGIINGYEDGSFKPDKIVRRDEFIKMVLVSNGYKLKNGDKYWASNYIKKAEELGYIKEDEFDDFRKEITRGEMSLISSRATEDVEEYLEPKENTFNILDIDKVTPKFQTAIKKSYKYNVLNGYPDGEFKPDKKLNRAESGVLVGRIFRLFKEANKNKEEIDDNDNSGSNDDENNTEEDELTFEEKYENWKEGWIEPEFYADRSNGSLWYIIEVKNLDDYFINKEEDYMNYRTKCEVLNYPELNQVDMLNFMTGEYGRLDLTKEDMIDGMFMMRKHYYTTRDKIDELILKEGMVIKHKVIVKRLGEIDGKKVEMKKEYFLEYEL